jgi:isoleucyl-tRNA synthetase
LAFEAVANKREEPLAGSFDPKVIEEKIRKYWETIHLRQRLEKAREGKELCGYVEGPPTLNGEPHLGHVRGRVIKDLWYRFSTLKGLNILFRAGWDTQGLPVELQAEKELGLVGSKSENLKIIGEEKLVEACKKLVHKYYEKWHQADALLGMFMDYEKAYWTYKDEYIEREWRYLEEASKRGLLGEGFRVVAYCPSCQTSLSYAEVGQGYEVVEDPSLYFKVKLKDSDTYLVLWTTMPFTVVTDEMVGVKPTAEYGFVKVGEETWIVGMARLDNLMGELEINSYQLLKVSTGAELEGLRYIHPLAELLPGQGKLDHNPKVHIVIAEDFVDISTGSGIVHMSPANGEEDFQTAQRREIPIFNPIDDQVKFTAEAGIFEGMFVRDTDQKVAELLRQKGNLLKLSTITHQYPTCWRSHHKVVWLARREYFYWVDKLEDLAVQAASKVEYYYEPPRNRFIEIVKERVPWCISRERIWGAPLPIWVCTNCGHKLGLFNRKAIIENAMELPNGPNFELHRPWIDKIIIKCPKCGGRSTREPYVLDTWHNSGASPFASFSEEEYNHLVPVVFLTEGIDQTRGWAYTLLIENCIMKNSAEAPYRAFLFQGHVLDANGNKMSKSQGNFVEGVTALTNYSVDTLRFYLMWKASPIESLNFSPEELRTRPFQILNTLYHLHVYFQQNSRYDGFNSEIQTVQSYFKLGLLKPQDLWLLSRLQEVKESVTTAFEHCKYHEGLRALEQFIIDDLSQTYIPMTRPTIWEDNPATLELRLAIYTVLAETLKTIDVLLHPVSLYVTEFLYTQCFYSKVPSIMLEAWPKISEELRNKTLEEEFTALETIVSITNSARMAAKLKRRWPLAKAVVVVQREIVDAVKKHLQLLSEMTNIKHIEVKTNLEEAPLTFKVTPKLDVLGRRLKEKIIPLKRMLDEADTHNLVEQLDKEGFIIFKIGGVEIEIQRDELIVEYVPNSSYSLSERNGVVVLLFVERDSNLIAEGMIRDLARRLQALRKQKGYNPTEILATAHITGLDDEWINIITPRLKELAYLVRVKNVDLIKEANEDTEWMEAEVDGNPIQLAIE